MRALRDQGFRVYVLAPEAKDEQASRQALSAEGFQVIPMKVRPYFHGLWNEVYLLYQLWRIYQQETFHLCIHYTIKPNMYGSLAAAWTGTPSVAVTTGLGILRHREQQASGHLLRTLYRLALKYSREVWFLNEEDQAFFLRKKICQPKQAFVLPGEGIDVWQFTSEPRIPHPEHSPVRVVFIGRLLWSKGLRELRTAAAYFRNRGLPVYFLLAGWSDNAHPDAVAPAVIAQWEQEGLFQYLGLVADVRPLLASADALILPSYSEGLSRVLLEAASMELPIIASDVAGCRQVVVDGKTGLLCQPANSDSLIRAIQSFLRLTPAQRAQLGTNARQYILQHHTQEHLVRAFLARLTPYLKPSNNPCHAHIHYSADTPTSCYPA